MWRRFRDSDYYYAVIAVAWFGAMLLIILAIISNESLFWTQ